MKKFTIIIAAMFIVTSAVAQDRNKPRWGVKAGLNIASESVDDASTNPRAGIFIGGSMEKTIGRIADFQLELLYSMQGGKFSPKNSSTTYTDKIDYIIVPVIFKFYVDKNRNWSIDLGPQVGYMISAKVSNGSTTTNIYDNDNMNKFDASMALGVSYKLNDHFDLGMRFTAGMTKITSVSDHKNNVVQIGAGYRF